MYKTIFCEMTFPRIDRPKLSAVSVATMNIRKIKDLSLAALRAARERLNKTIYEKYSTLL